MLYKSRSLITFSDRSSSGILGGSKGGVATGGAVGRCGSLKVSIRWCLIGDDVNH